MPRTRRVTDEFNEAVKLVGKQPGAMVTHIARDLVSSKVCSGAGSAKSMVSWTCEPTSFAQRVTRSRGFSELRRVTTGAIF
jgi:hypothetical protein